MSASGLQSTAPEDEMTELEKFRAENKLLKAQNKWQEMEMALKKLGEIACK